MPFLRTWVMAATKTSMSARVLETVGYIERNPLEAGLALELWQYAWSSCGANACGTADSLLAENPYYLESGPDDSSRQRQWRGLFMHEDPKDPLIRRADWALGDEPLPRQ
jgi:hypothetical protein